MSNTLSGSKLKIAVFAAPLSGNKGSASMVWGLLDLLKREGFSVTALIYSYYPAQDSTIAKEIPDVDVRPGHPRDLLVLTFRILLSRILGPLSPPFLRRPSKELMSCDLACIAGGTTFSDTMLYKAPWNVLAAIPSWLTGRPFIFVSQTMGPFQKWPNRLAARWTLRRAHRVYGRGPTSTQLVQELGISKASYQPDLSFGMNSITRDESPLMDKWLSMIEKASKETGRPPVGITPNTIVESLLKSVGMDYHGLLAAIVVDIYHRGFYPIIIPHSFKAGSKGRHNNDVGLCHDVMKLLESDIPHIFIDDDLSSQELRHIIGHLKFLIASRFHSMISALSQGTPSITIGWGAQKYKEVLSVYNMADTYIDFNEASLVNFRNKFDWVLDNQDLINSRIAEGNKKNQSLIKEFAQSLISFSHPGH
jgi:colanic acid/amylovoran biosynthesis protein